MILGQMVRGGGEPRVFFGVRRLGAAFIPDGLPSSGVNYLYQATLDGLSNTID